MAFHRSLLVAVFAAGILAAAPAGAAQQEQKKEEKSTFMSPATYNRISRAHDAIEEGKYQSALESLQDLADDVKERPYEYAVTLQTIGYVYIAQEDFETAVKYYRRALELNALPTEPEKQVVYTLAQLYATLGQFQNTINMLEQWFKTAENPPADAYVMLANAYAALERFKEAYPPIKQALAKADQPKEDWYKLALGIQFELQKYREAAETLEVLIANWPERDMYWRQLSGIYLQLEEDAKALATMALAYERGMIEKGEDILNLVRLYMLNGVPVKAGEVLSKGIQEGKVENTLKNQELLAQAWIQAREFDKGIAALGEAAKLSDDGELFIRQAQLYVSMANWDGVAAAARRALEKGGLDQKKTGQAWLLLGTASAEKKDFNTAVEAFNKARGYEDTRRTATQWLNFVQTEQQVTSLN